MGLNLLVTGGYFDAGADGVIHHVDLERGRVETWARWAPPPHLAVPTKGFTGARRDREYLWVAAHAAVLRFKLAEATVDGLLHQPDFNDLHDVALTSTELLVANTGSDTVERYTHAGTFVGRSSWLPGWVQARRLSGHPCPDFDQVCRVGWSGRAPPWPRSEVPGGEAEAGGYLSSAEVRARSPYHQTKITDRVHPNHLVDVDGEWFATCLYDGSLRSLSDMGTRLSVPGYPHDGVVEGRDLWLTTIDGGIWRAPLPLGSEPARRVAEAFVDGQVGWCRGLLLTSEFIVVGLSEVRPDRLPRHPWAEVDPRGSVTGLVVLDRASFTALHFIDLTDRARHHKIYTIMEAL